MQAECKKARGGHRRNIPAARCVFFGSVKLLRSSKMRLNRARENADAVSQIARRPNQLLGGNSIGPFCLPVLNSMIFRETPGKIAEIGLTRSTGLSVVPTTS
jgi:hypothetical protein